jgi:hypothetical protein
VEAGHDRGARGGGEDMKEIIVTTQAEYDEIASDFDGLIIIKGDVSISVVPISAHVVAWESAHVQARESAHVVAWESSHVQARESAHVVAWGSAHVEACGSSHVEACGSAHVEAWGSSHVEACGSAHVEAWESAHVEAWESAHVEAWGSSHVVAWGSSHVEACGSAHVVACGSSHVQAWESAHVVAWGSSHVEAGKWVSVRKMLSHTGQIVGGIVIPEPKITTAEDWCAYQGSVVKDGVAILYKAVRDDYRSMHGFLYVPASMPACTDWDGGAEECGSGLHFCATPAAALTFDDQATRFVACPVALDDMRAPKMDDSYSYKIKASRICGPIVEVDRYGEPINAEVRT